MKNEKFSKSLKSGKILKNFLTRKIKNGKFWKNLK